MADQEQDSKPTGEPAPTPGGATPSTPQATPPESSGKASPEAGSGSASDQAGDPAAALDAAQAAIDDLSAESATPSHAGVEDGAAEALKTAQEAIAAATSAGDAPAAANGNSATPVAMPELQRAPAQATTPTPAAPGELNLLSDVNLHVTIELGRTRMLVEDVLRLGEGSVVELDKPAGDPVDVYVNDRHVARGEVLVVNENFCVRISEIIENGAGAEGDRATR